MSADLNSGVLAPVSDEQTFTDLAVSGVIPSELQGTLLRNGPNPFSGRFQGEGVTSWWPQAAMLHAVDLRAGRASYKNRWVRTSAYCRFFEQPDHRAIDSNPNVNVIRHRGDLLALAEGGPPVQVNQGLDTLGQATNPRLPWPGETAHPKVDTRTGEYMTFLGSWAAPHLRYGVLDAEGNVAVDLVIDQPVASMMHDMAITEHYSVLLDLNVGYDFSMLDRGHSMPIRWLPEKSCDLIIVPRRGGEVVRVAIESCFIQHVVNAYESAQDHLIFDAVRYPHYFVLDEHSDQYQPDPLGALWRYEIDLQQKVARESKRLQAHVELPRINESFTGYPYRYAYMVAQPTDKEMRGLLRYDFQTGQTNMHNIAAGDQNSEPVFVPHPNALSEDHGWVLTVVYRGAEDRSDLLILDAADLTAAPVATVHLPRRIPAGFHGAWCAGCQE